VHPNIRLRTAAITLVMLRFGACSFHASAAEPLSPEPPAPDATPVADAPPTPDAPAAEPPLKRTDSDMRFATLDERVVAEPGKGVTLRSLDGRYSLNVKPRVQIRDTFTHDTRDLNDLELKTLRLVISGNILSPDLRFFVQLALASGDYEKDSSSPIYDAYVEYTGLRDLSVKAGQFLVPFDRVRTVREYAVEFVDRSSMVRELMLDRDVGLTVGSSNLLGWGNRLAYALYIGSGDGKNRTGGQILGPLLIARVTLRPFGAFDDDIEGDLNRERRPRLAIGLAGGYNIHSPRTQSTFGNTFTLGYANYVHAAADVVFKLAGFSFVGELLVRHAQQANFKGMSNGKPVTEYTRSGYGYMLEAGMMLSRFVQATLRWEQLFAENNTDPTLITTAATAGRQLGAGLNLYLNGHGLKIQADYFYIWGVVLSAARHAVRLQLDASF
jgi:hypothetical protein